MRVVAGTPQAAPYKVVWHVPKCKRLYNVKWIDDETMQYGQYLDPINQYSVEEVIQAKKIELLPVRGLVLIDPVPDEEAENLNLEVEICV